MTSALKQYARRLRRIGRAVDEYALRALGRFRSVQTLEHSAVGSLAELFSRPTPSYLCLHDPAALPPIAEPLFKELANDEILNGHHAAPSCSTGIGLVSVPDAIVSGASLVGSARSVYELGSIVPGYVDILLKKSMLVSSHAVGNRQIARLKMRDLKGVSILVTHWNAHVYGHWLLECMPKLLLLRQILTSLPPCRIVMPSSLPSWITEWVKLVLPNLSVEYFNPRKEYLRCERLLLPTALIEGDHHFHPALAPLLDALCPPATETLGDKHLYVSRLKPSYYRELSNQREIEEIAVSEGMSLVYPERLTISEQIKLFASARVVVGEFGSAMHNTLFCPPGTKVLALNWINNLQSRVAHLKKHQVGYLLPSSGAPVKHSESQSTTWYHIDPKSFRQCVRALTT